MKDQPMLSSRELLHDTLLAIAHDAAGVKNRQTPAFSQRVVDAKVGDPYRIVDPLHSHAGKTGTLEFIVGGAAWLRVGGEDVSAKIEQLHLVQGVRHD